MGTKYITVTNWSNINSRIDRIKELYLEGINIPHLKKFTLHWQDGTSSTNRFNDLTLEEWAKLFNTKNPIDVVLTENQIDKIIKYFMEFIPISFSKTQKGYKCNVEKNSILEDDYLLEYLTLASFNSLNPD